MDFFFVYLTMLEFGCSYAAAEDFYRNHEQTPGEREYDRNGREWEILEDWKEWHQRGIEAEMHAYYTALFAAEDAEREANAIALDWDAITDRLERASYPSHFRLTDHAWIGHKRTVRFRHKPKAKRGVFRYPRPKGRDRLRDEPETSPGRNKVPSRAEYRRAS